MQPNSVLIVSIAEKYYRLPSLAQCKKWTFFVEFTVA